MFVLFQWEQRYIEESTMRQIAVDAASVPKYVLFLVSHLPVLNALLFILLYDLGCINKYLHICLIFILFIFLQ